MIRSLLSRLKSAPLPVPIKREEPKVTRPNRPGLRIRGAVARVPLDADKTFKVYTPPPGVRGDKAVAMDSMPGMGGWLGDNFASVSQFLEDGLYFKGYPILAAMMLRAEFRKPVEVIAKECTREWVKFKSTQTKPGQENSKSVQAKIDELEKEFERLRVRQVVHKHIIHGLAFGMGHIQPKFKTATGEDLPLVIGPNGIKKGDLDRLVNIEPVWTNPSTYTANDPMDEGFYKPQTWWVMGKEVHASRLFTTVPFEVPDILKPAFNFGGLSLTQQLEAYVHNFLRTRQSVSDLVSNFATKILKTNMAGNMQTDSGLNYSDIDADSVTGRLQAMTAWQSNNGAFVLDKESEEFEVAQVSLAGLPDLQAQSQEFMASIPGLPLVKLFGIQPTGLNASSDGEIRVFYDEMSAYQEAHVEPALREIFNLAQINLWGDIDPRIDYDYVPMWQLSEKEAAEVEKIKADIDALNIQEGKITADEAREREASDSHSIYTGVELSGPAPEPPDMGEFAPGEKAPNPKELMEAEQ